MSDRGSWNAFLSHPASGAGCEISGWNGGEAEFRMSDIRVECAMPQVTRGPSTCARCRDPSPWWHGARIAIRSNSIRIPQEDTWRAPLSGLPQGEVPDTRDHHTWTIAYLIRICFPDHWIKCTSLATSFRQPATAHVPPPSDGVSGRSVRISFAMDSKELSSISDCFGDKKAIKTPKLNTIWLELIARVLNMLIGLKGDNYYSKVFKRVNYKLWNNTFWVVITKLTESRVRPII